MNHRAVARISVLGLAPIGQKQPCIDFREIIGGSHHDIVSPAWLVKLPGGLEEFEELLNDLCLTFLGDNAYQSIIFLIAPAPIPSRGQSRCARRPRLIAATCPSLRLK